MIPPMMRLLYKKSTKMSINKTKKGVDPIIYAYAQMYEKNQRNLSTPLIPVSFGNEL